MVHSAAWRHLVSRSHTLQNVKMYQDNPRNKRTRLNNAYSGYSVAGDGTVPVSADPKAFFADFIETRTPCIVRHKIPVKITEFTLENIESRLQYDELLQVERKFAFGFGLGTRRELKSLHDIVSRLKEGDDTYYLTTQYEDADDARLDLDDLEDEEVFDRALFPGTNDGSSGAAGQDADSSDESDFPDSFDGVDDFDALNGNNEEYRSDSGSQNEPEGDDFDDSVDEPEYVVHKHKLTQEDALNRVETLLQPPLTNVVHHGEFPIVPNQFEPLVTQQINLWMGCSAVTEAPDLKSPSIESLGKYVPRGNSSGLHHDHADNLYVLVEGIKRFTIYLPGDAEQIYTVGNIKQVFANGLIDYQTDEKAPFWRHLRADGAILSDWAEWRLELEDLSDKEKKYLENLVESDRPEPCLANDKQPKLDPPSFSRIPPILAHLDEVEDPEVKKALEAFAEKEFPGFLLLKKLEIWLNPGEMLYLPAGWFHEVTSFGDSDKPQHVALNWWFVPPTGPSTQPYEDGYWTTDFEATKAALEWVKEIRLEQN